MSNVQSFDCSPRVSRSDLRIYTLNFCNSYNRTGAIDKKNSSGHQVTYRCKEYLHNGAQCPFKVVWKLDRLLKRESNIEKWHVDKPSLCLQHNVGICCGKAEVTAEQVLTNEDMHSVVASHVNDKSEEILGKLPYELKSQNHTTRQRLLSSIRCAVKKARLQNKLAYGGVKSWIELFARDNPGSVTACECTEEGEFHRVFLMPKCIVDAVITTNIRIHAMDSGTVIAEDGFDGVVMLMEAVNSNLTIIPIAIALARVENGDNYKWFLDNMKRDPRLAEYLNSSNTVIISDRDKGLHKSVKEQLPCARHRSCAIHIKKNLIKHIGSRSDLGKKHEKFWKVAGAKTRAQYEKALSELRVANPNAAAYLEKIPPETWVLYTAIEQGIPLYGRRSSNDAECEMARLKKLNIRHSTPLSFLDGVAKYLMNLVSSQVSESQSLMERRRFCSDAVENIYRQNEEMMKGFTLSHNNADVFVMTQDLYRYRVDFNAKWCSCGQWQQHDLICCHGVYAARAKWQERSSVEYYEHVIGQCYHTSTFAAAYPCTAKIVLPDFAEITETDMIKPKDAKRGVGAQSKNRMKAATEHGGVSCRTPKQRRQAVEHAAKLQYDEFGHELPVEKTPVPSDSSQSAKKCRHCYEYGHMAKTCTNSDAHMLMDDSDGLLAVCNFNEDLTTYFSSEICSPSVANDTTSPPTALV